MQKSAFKFHSGNSKEYNALEYFFNLKDAKSQLLNIYKDNYSTSKITYEHNMNLNSNYEIFNVYRNKILTKQKYIF